LRPTQNLHSRALIQPKKISALREDLLQVRNYAVCFYVLRDDDSLYLIDTGFIGGISCLDHALARKGWDKIPIRGIILTHGHLDHILNVSELAKRHGAWIAAPRLDADYYVGKAVYHGISRITGVTEAIGRKVLSFQTFTPTRLIDDGDQLDIWHGLEAILLPGHTAGHTGYYCKKLGLLFSADLFASCSSSPCLPPKVFNANSEQIPISVNRALQLEITGVVPNHCDLASPEEHLARLKLLSY
jgi:glyoxylase-like metal-dependent hydrolase (beta-lactamase superfamily II)